MPTKCIENCDVCFSTDTCRRCSNGFGTQGNSSQCVECPSNCAVCETDNVICSVCDPGYTIESGNCVVNVKVEEIDVGLIAGAVAGGLSLVLIIGGVVLYFCCLRKRCMCLVPDTIDLDIVLKEKDGKKIVNGKYENGEQIGSTTEDIYTNQSEIPQDRESYMSNARASQMSNASSASSQAAWYTNRSSALSHSHIGQRGPRDSQIAYATQSSYATQGRTRRESTMTEYSRANNLMSSRSQASGLSQSSRPPKPSHAPRSSVMSDRSTSGMGDVSRPASMMSSRASTRSTIQQPPPPAYVSRGSALPPDEGDELYGNISYSNQHDQGWEG